jgi:proteic killer suppression protein
MEVVFRHKDFDRLETDSDFTAGFSSDIVKAYRNRLWAIRNATDERDIYVLKSWHFEKLSGDRSHQRSIRLNGQWRLIIEIIESKPANVIEIVGIEDYH